MTREEEEEKEELHEEQLLIPHHKGASLEEKEEEKEDFLIKEKKHQEEKKQQEAKDEQQSPPSMDTTEQAITVNLLKPLPYPLPTNQIYVYILGEIKSQGKWLRRMLIPWFHALHEWRIKVGIVHKRGAHGDGVPENIKLHPP